MARVATTRVGGDLPLRAEALTRTVVVPGTFVAVVESAATRFLVRETFRVYSHRTFAAEPWRRATTSGAKRWPDANVEPTRRLRAWLLGSNQHYSMYSSRDIRRDAELYWDPFVERRGIEPRSLVLQTSAESPD